MNNCHNCKRMTNETRVQHKCEWKANGIAKWIDEQKLALECANWQEKEPREAVEVKKSCANCKHGVPDANIRDGIRCAGGGGRGCAKVCYYDYEEHGLEKYNKWESKEADLKAKINELKELLKCFRQ